MESTSKKKTTIHKGENVECTRNSRSMGNLHELCNREEQHHGLAHDDSGNHSDYLPHLHSGRPAQVRKKGIPWTASEHRCFLIGLEKLGKGDWKGISKNYVPTKTPAQVASHAQKYFLRIAAAEKKNRRASLFDIPFKQSSSPPHASTAASFDASEGSQRDGLLANIAANEKKPPLSPATGTNASDACHISYINSHAHASTAASFNALEGSQQVMTAAVDPLKKASENHGLDGLPANIATNEKKPPLSPATRTNAPDACHISYIAGVPGQSFPAAHVMPQTELYPMLNYTYPSYYYDSSSHANFPAKGLFLQPHSITHGTSQSTTNNYNS